MKYWWNISVLKSVSPCQIFVIEKLSVGTILQCHTLVIQYGMSSWKKKKKNERKKKEKKGKENLRGSEKNVVGVKEMAQG